MQPNFDKIPGFCGFSKKFRLKQYFDKISPYFCDTYCFGLCDFLNDNLLCLIVHPEFPCNNLLVSKSHCDFSNNNSLLPKIWHMWPSIRKHVLSTKAFFRGFEVTLKPFWNPLETLLEPFGNTLKPFENPFETLWNPFETLSKRFETLWKPFETLGKVGTLWKSLRNVLHTLRKAALKMSGEKYSCNSCSPSTCQRMHESTACYKHIYIYIADMLFCCMFKYWFIYSYGNQSL